MLGPSLTNSWFNLFHWKAKRLSGLDFCDKLPISVYFCCALNNFYLSLRHIDLIIWYFKWKLKRGGWIVFPRFWNFPITKKPTEVRMGKGKGGIVDWSIPTKKTGIPVFFLGKPTPLVWTLLLDIKAKLPFTAKICLSKHRLWQLSPVEIFLQQKKWSNLTGYLTKKCFSN
jgi:large subunit ribosomal protein L16